MNKVNNMLVAVFINKRVECGNPNWAVVFDFNNGKDFVRWFSERRKFYKQVAITDFGDFNLLEEVDEFKSYLKAMLNIGPSVSFSEEKWEKYNDLSLDMFHYDEEEFDKLIKNCEEGR